MERVQKQLDEQVDAKQAVVRISSLHDCFALDALILCRGNCQDAELTRTKEELERCKRELGYSTSMIKLHRNDNDELQAVRDLVVYALRVLMSPYRTWRICASTWSFVLVSWMRAT